RLREELRRALRARLHVARTAVRAGAAVREDRRAPPRRSRRARRRAGARRSMKLDPTKLSLSPRARELAARLDARAPLAAFVLVALLAAKIDYGTLSALDLGLDDETYALAAGIRLWHGPLPHADTSPLYSVWYRVLAYVVTDPAQLYFANWWLLETGLAVAL